MQVHFQFAIKIAKRYIERKDVRFLVERQIIDRLRSAIGSIVKELKSEPLVALVGKRPPLADTNKQASWHKVRSQENANAIAKWHCHIDDFSSDSSDYTGTIVLVLESSLPPPENQITSLVIQAASEKDLYIKLLSVQSMDVDYDLSGNIQTYYIDSYHPAPVNHSSKTKEENYAIFKERYPVARDPDALNRLSTTVGKVIKRHIIEFCDYYQLENAVVQDQVFKVKAYWKFIPPKVINRSNTTSKQSAAITVIFSCPLMLSGSWSVGSLRHKGAGLIKLANDKQCQSLKRGGVYIL